MTEERGSAVDQYLFKLENIYRELAEHSPLPRLAVEGESYIVRFVNSAFCRVAGKERAELLGHPFAEIMPHARENGSLALLERVYRTGVTEKLTEQEAHNSHSVYWSFFMWAIFGENARPGGVIILMTDETEIVLYRRQMTQINQELILSSIRQHELTESTEKLNALLETAIRGKEYFLAVLSHELRTPLAPVLVAVSLLLLETTFDEQTREILEMVHRNITLEARLIDDLLDMTRIERGKLAIDRRPIDLYEMIERAVEVCRPDLEAGGLGWRVESEEGPIIVDGDAGRLQQVFWNLLRNSIKFTPRGGHVWIRCRREGDSVVVAEVADDGKGIHPEFLPHVFGAFEQGDKTLIRKLGGLGLGLAICKSLVEMHGGTITARSEGEDKGATFSVRLPILAKVRSVRVEAKPARSSERPPVRPLRILLVEDHADTGRIMGRLLRGDGHAVQWATDLATGLKLAEQEPFDLLLSDLGLPDGSGVDLMRSLRARGSGLLGIALSGYGQVEDIAKCREVGFTAHLTKPVDLEKLRRTIRGVTGGSGAVDPAGRDSSGG